MAHLIQVGAGSGGMPVLDMLCRDPRIHRVTLIEPDLYKPHNVERHLFPLSATGEFKAILAEQWLKERRPHLEIETLLIDICDPAQKVRLDQAAAAADLGICAADNEMAKYAWDALMRRHGKNWTLGEVLSGGIGGFVHWFIPGGPCYGCVAGHLQRNLTEGPRGPAPDYSAPEGPVAETTIPASMASIHAIAALHTLVSRDLLEQGTAYNPGFTSLLLSLQRVPEVFEDQYRPFRIRVPRAADCLICQARPSPASVEELDVALDQALARLGDE